MSARFHPVLLAVLFLSGCEFDTIGIDISASEMNGGFVLNGAAFPNDPDESGVFLFHGEHDDDVIVAAPTQFGSYDTFLVNGSYDARYTFNQGGAVVPSNQDALVLQDHDLVADIQLPLPIEAISVTVAYSLNGEPFPESQYESGAFYLQLLGSDTLIDLSDSRMGSGTARVLPGTYNVLYAHLRGTLCPQNGRTIVAAELELTGDTELAVDVVAGPMDLRLTLDGGDFPASEYDDATLHLRDAATGGEAMVMNTHSPVSEIFLIPGTFDLLYRHETGTEVPLNTEALLVDDHIFDLGGSLFHDVVSVDVGAEVTLDGAAFPASEYDDGVLYLRDVHTEALTELGNTHASITDRMFIGGTYDVVYSHESGDLVPQNVLGTVASGVLVDGPLLVDVHSIEVGAHPTLDGLDFPNSEYDDANLFLVGEGGELLVGNTHDGAPSILVMPGSYDLVYRHETGEDVPKNTNALILEDQLLEVDTVLSPNLSTSLVSVWTPLNGQTFPATNVGSGNLYAQTRDGDAVLLGETGLGVPPAMRLITGDYAFVYEYAGGEDVPHNPWVVVHRATID